MNRRLHSGAVALFCFGVLLLMIGWLGFKGVPKEPIMCSDPYCTESHP